MFDRSNLWLAISLIRQNSLLMANLMGFTTFNQREISNSWEEKDGSILVQEIGTVQMKRNQNSSNSSELHKSHKIVFILNFKFHRHLLHIKTEQHDYM